MHGCLDPTPQRQLAANTQKMQDEHFNYLTEEEKAQQAREDESFVPRGSGQRPAILRWFDVEAYKSGIESGAFLDELVEQAARVLKCGSLSVSFEQVKELYLAGTIPYTGKR